RIGALDGTERSHLGDAVRYLPARGRIDEQERAMLLAEGRRRGPRRHAVVVGGRCVGRNAEQVEDVGLQQREHPRLGARAGVAGIAAADHLGVCQRRAVRARAAIGAVRARGRRGRRAEAAVDAQELRLLLEDLRDETRARRVDRHVEERLARAAAAALDRVALGVGVVEHLQVEERAVVRVLRLGLVLDGDRQVHAPAAGAGGLELAAGEGERRRLRQAAALTGRDAYDDGLAAAVQEELLHGVAHRAVTPQTAEGALVVGVAADLHRLVDRTAPGAADERGDRGRDAGDGTHRARQLLDV